MVISSDSCGRVSERRKHGKQGAERIETDYLERAYKILRSCKAFLIEGPWETEKTGFRLRAPKSLVQRRYALWEQWEQKMAWETAQHWLAV